MLEDHLFSSLLDQWQHPIPKIMQSEAATNKKLFKEAHVNSLIRPFQKEHVA